MVMIFWWVTGLLLLAGIVVWAITFWNRRSLRQIGRASCRERV